MARMMRSSPKAASFAVSHGSMIEDDPSGVLRRLAASLD
jgi:hypothetical protein